MEMIGNISERDLFDLGFAKIKDINPVPPGCENYAYRHRGFHLFVWSNDKTLHFRWSCGNTKIDTLYRLKVLMAVLGF